MKRTIRHALTALLLLCAIQWTSQADAQTEVEPVWSGLKNLSSLEYNAIAPTILADESGLHILFQSLRLSGDCSVSYIRSTDKGKTWSEPVTLSKNFSMGVGTSLLSLNGILHAAWCPTERGLNGLYYRQSTDGGRNWTPRSTVNETTKAIYFPKFATDGPDLYLAWIEQQKIGSDLSIQAPGLQDLDVQNLEQNRRNFFAGSRDDEYDSTLLLAKSPDGGKTWGGKVPAKRIFSRIRNYTVHIDGKIQTFEFMTPEGVSKIVSRDGGLTWKEEPITEQEFGNPKPPMRVDYKGDIFKVGTHKINNREVVFVKRTDTNPPESQMVSSPSVVDSTRVFLEWTGEDDWSDTDKLSYSYRLDDATWSEISKSTSTQYDRLLDGEHTFEVISMDEAGNKEEEPVRATFKVMSPPNTYLVSVPEKIGNDPGPQVSWRGRDNTTAPENLKFQYRIDSEQWSRSLEESEMKLPRLVDGMHTLSVRAVDEIGAVDPFPANVSFRVDTLGPRTTRAEVAQYVRGASTLFLDVMATDNFSATPELEYSIQVDDGEWEPFTKMPSISVLGLSDGPHQLRVRARDEAGNIEDTPYLAAFNVAIPPKVEIAESPQHPIAPGAFQLFLNLWDNDTPPEKIQVRYRINDNKWIQAPPGPILNLNVPKLPDGRHQLELEATDQAGLTDPMTTMFEFVVDSKQLPPPSYVQAKIIGNKVDLSWPEPSKTISGTIRYNLYRSDEAGFGTGAILESKLIVQDLEDRFYTDTLGDDQIDQTLYYAVSLRDSSGKASNLSPVAVVSPSEAPEGLEKSEPVAAAESPGRSIEMQGIGELFSNVMKFWPVAAAVVLIILALLAIKTLFKGSQRPVSVDETKSSEEDVMGLIDGKGSEEEKQEQPSAEDSTKRPVRDEDIDGIL